ncbi:hypothetical protein XENOCAPTIV_017653, partial [Xenoophorus captivus]
SRRDITCAQTILSSVIFIQLHDVPNDQNLCLLWCSDQLNEDFTVRGPRGLDLLLPPQEPGLPCDVGVFFGQVLVNDTSDPFSNLPCFSTADLCFRLLNLMMIAGLSLLPRLGRGCHASTESQSSFIPLDKRKEATCSSVDSVTPGDGSPALPPRRRKSGA